MAALVVIGGGAFLLLGDDDDGASQEVETTAADDTTTEVFGSLPDPTEEPDGLGDDAALDALAEECYDGDMAACDELFTESPLDSEYEAYGDSCAGRQAEDTRVYCEDSFPD